MRILTTAILATAAVITCAAGSAPAAADELKWDPKEVLRIADALVKVIDEGLAASSAAPPQGTVIQQRTRDAAVSGMHQVHDAAEQLAAKLRTGGDRDTTVAYYRNVRDGMAITRRAARDAVPTPQVDRKLHEASELLRQLARFYPGD